jgi:ribosome biogenesis protein ENP2
MKFERHLECEIVQLEVYCNFFPSYLQILSEDYSKLVFLRADRTIEFHASFGNYYQTRIPRFGRDMLYHPSTCDLYTFGASSDIWRLNLEQGQFLNPISSKMPGVNTGKFQLEVLINKRCHESHSQFTGFWR